MSLKDTVRTLAHRLGYDIRSLAQTSALRQSVAESYALARRLGFVPATVIDVGAATGTAEIYAAFPGAYLLLVEPLPQCRPALKAVLRRHRGSLVAAAAGALAGEARFNVHRHHLDGSSLYKESMGAEADGDEVTVPVVRIDDVVAGKALAAPFLMKVDVQGAELDVLDGAPLTLAQCELVVLEVSLFGFMTGAPQFADVVASMKQRGFVAWDIVLGWNRPLDGALGQVDIAFVKQDGRFRRDHGYATVEQMKALFGG